MDGLLNPHSHWLLAWYIYIIGCDNPTTARRPTYLLTNQRPPSRLKRTAPPTPGLVFCFFCLYSFSFIQFNSVCFHFHFSLFSFFPSSILSSILSSLLLFFLLSTFSLSLFSSLTFLSAYLSYSLSLSWAVVALLPYYYFPYNQCRLPRRNDCPRLGGIYSIFSSTTTSAIPWYVRLALTPSKTLLIIIITIFITLLIATPSLQPACGAFT